MTNSKKKKNNNENNTTVHIHDNDDVNDNINVNDNSTSNTNVSNSQINNNNTNNNSLMNIINNQTKLINDQNNAFSELMKQFQQININASNNTQTQSQSQSHSNSSSLTNTNAISDLDKLPIFMKKEFKSTINTSTTTTSTENELNENKSQSHNNRVASFITCSGNPESLPNHASQSEWVKFKRSLTEYLDSQNCGEYLITRPKQLAEDLVDLYPGMSLQQRCAYVNKASINILSKLSPALGRDVYDSIVWNVVSDHNESERSNVFLIWKEALAQFNTTSIAYIENLQVQFNSKRYTLQDKPIEWFGEMDRIKRELDDLSYPILPNAYIIRVINALPPEMEVVRQQLTDQRNGLPTMRHIRTRMDECYEANQRNGKQRGANQMNAAVQSSLNFCTDTRHNPKSLHTEAQCYKIHPHLAPAEYLAKQQQRKSNKKFKSNSNNKTPTTPATPAILDPLEIHGLALYDATNELTNTSHNPFTVENSQLLQHFLAAAKESVEYVPRYNLFCVDSGASMSGVVSLSLLFDIKQFDVPRTINTAGGSVKVEKYGSLQLTDSVIMYRVAYIPGSKVNMLSYKHLRDAGCIIECVKDAADSSDVMYIRNSKNVLYFKAICRSGSIYYYERTGKEFISAMNKVNSQKQITNQQAHMSSINKNTNSSNSSSSDSTSTSISTTSSPLISLNSKHTSTNPSTRTHAIQANVTFESNTINSCFGTMLCMVQHVPESVYDDMHMCNKELQQREHSRNGHQMYLSNCETCITGADMISDVPSDMYAVLTPQQQLIHERNGHQNYVAGCTVCTIGKGKRRSYGNKPSEDFVAKQAGDRLHIDIMGPMSTYIGKHFDRVPTVGGKIYALMIVDEYTRYAFVRLLAYKDEATECIIELCTWLNIKLGRVVREIHSDQGGEFVNKVMHQYGATHGTSLTTTLPRTPEHNGIIERLNGTAMNAARCMMAQADIVISLWGDALVTAIYLHNIKPRGKIGVSPYQLFHGFVPNTSHLRVFGCDALVMVPNVLRGKVDPRWERCVFIGYDITKDGWFRGYHMLRIEQSISNKNFTSNQNCKVTSLDVRFTENKFGLNKIAYTLVKQKQLLQLHHPQIHSDTNIHSHTNNNNNNNNQSISSNVSDNIIDMASDVSDQSESEVSDRSESDNNSETSDTGTTNLNEEHKSATSNDSNASPTQSYDIENNHDNRIIYDMPSLEPEPYHISFTNHNSSTHIKTPKKHKFKHKSINHANETRHSTRERKPIDFFQSFGIRPGYVNCHDICAIAYDVVAAAAYGVDININPTYKEAMLSIHKSQWNDAIKGEFKSLSDQNVYQVVPCPIGIKPIGTKMVLRIKLNSNNEIERFKARLVVQGFAQQFGFNYTDTYAPVGSYKSFKLFLIYCVEHGYTILQFDYPVAFLNANLNEEIYVRIPDGFVAPPNYVWKLNKTLYGLKQSPYEWNKLIDEMLVELGYRALLTDPCVYKRLSKTGRWLLIYLYVDDKAVGIHPDDKDEWELDLKPMQVRFNIKVLGLCTWFLNMKITQINPHELVLSQETYVRSLLKQYGMNEVRNSHCMLPSVDDYTKPLDGTAAVPLTSAQHTLYRSIVGSTSYAANFTRPDITFTVSKLSGYLAVPFKHHLDAAYVLLSYLSGTPHYCLRYTKASKLTPLIKAYTDSDYASDTATLKSRSAGIHEIGGNVATWFSHSQNIIAQSSTEAEFIALNSCEREVRFLSQWQQQLQLPVGTTTILTSAKSVPLIMCDNRGAIALSQHDTDHRNTKHINVKLFSIREQVANKSITIKWISSLENKADLLTKHMKKPAFNHLVAQIMDIGVGFIKS